MSKRRTYAPVVITIDQLSDYLPKFANSKKRKTKTITDDSDPEQYQIEFRIRKKFISYYETGLTLLRNGQSLADLTKRDFERFIADWLFYKKWNGTSMSSKNGFLIQSWGKFNGEYFKYVWLIKKYSPNHPIGIRIIKELDYLIYELKATKGVIISTSFLTNEAKAMLEENRFRMFYIDLSMLENELSYICSQEFSEDLPF